MRFLKHNKLAVKRELKYLIANLRIPGLEKRWQVSLLLSILTLSCMMKVYKVVKSSEPIYIMVTSNRKSIQLKLNGMGSSPSDILLITWELMPRVRVLTGMPDICGLHVTLGSCRVLGIVENRGSWESWELSIMGVNSVHSREVIVENWGSWESGLKLWKSSLTYLCQRHLMSCYQLVDVEYKVYAQHYIVLIIK